MALRKSTNHPYLFDGIEPEPFETGEHLIDVSGKLIVLDRILAYLKETGQKVLIFSGMTRMLDIGMFLLSELKSDVVVQDYLTFRGYEYERLDGSIRNEERYMSIQSFKKQDRFVFLLSTRAGGLGLNLTEANIVIFLDMDMNPAMDDQAAVYSSFCR